MIAGRRLNPRKVEISLWGGISGGRGFISASIANLQAACYYRDRMKRWVIRIGIVLGLFLTILFGAAFWSDMDVQKPTTKIKNEEFPTIKEGWLGTDVDQKGRFINDEFPFLPKVGELLKWQLSTNKFKAEKQNDTQRLEVRDPSAFLASENDGILWLGHATFFIRLDGVSILTDPIFGTPPLVKRYVEVPSPLEQIRQVDYVLLSHDHRDHMDEGTLRQIAQKFPKAVFLAGLNSEDVLNEWRSPDNPVKTAGWFQKYNTTGPVGFYFVPVRHWSRRGLLDTNKRLWGGYVIQSKTATIYFGGDSGYGRHYREVGELFPNIDYFLMGIGAYEPRWFMEANHNNPADVIKAFKDAGARILIPMHYGTFDLSDEPPSAPLRSLLEEAAAAGISDKVRPLSLNEDLQIVRSQ